MSRFFLLMLMMINLSYGAVYDTFTFTAEEEKYSLYFCNTATSAQFTAIGLTTTDATAVLALRPLLSLTPVETNVNITGNDMKRIREISYTMVIPDHTVYNEYHALGIKQYEFNFFMALLGAFFGFVFVFFMVYSMVNISRGLKG